MEKINFSKQYSLFLEKQYITLVNLFPTTRAHNKAIALFSSTIISLLTTFFSENKIFIFMLITFSIFYSFKVLTIDIEIFSINDFQNYRDLENHIANISKAISDYEEKTEKYLKNYLIVLILFTFSFFCIIEIIKFCSCNASI